MAYTVTRNEWVSVGDMPADTEDDYPTDTETWVAEYAASFEAEANRPLSVTVVDERCEVLKMASGDLLVVTKHRPVASVEDISYNDAEPDYDLSSGNIRLTDATMSLLRPASFAMVSYTATFSDEIMTACRHAVVERTMRRVTRRLNDTVGTDSVSEEGMSATYAPDAWTEPEKAVIAAVRRRVGT